MVSIAIVGATGIVGRELLQILPKSFLANAKIHCFASTKSEGKSLLFGKDQLIVQELKENSFQGMDIVFFCAGAAISQKYIPLALQAKAKVIDNSSFYRLDKDVPLVIPEINAHTISPSSHLIASPNCTATILLMPLFLLHRKFRIKRIVAATYQAASGGGIKLMNKLLYDTKQVLDKKNIATSDSYGFNLFLHDTQQNAQRFSSEEEKVVLETRKILQDDDIAISVTCVRVPIIRAHSIAANIEFHEDFELPQVYDILQQTPSVKILEDFPNRRFATPNDASKNRNTFCSRIRKDPCHPRTLDMWIVGDQLLKGAALNALQIAEYLCS